MPVDTIFESIALNEQGQKRLASITLAFNDLLDGIRPIVPEGREWSIIKTKLEEACFYAKRGMSLAATNQGSARSAGSAG